MPFIVCGTKRDLRKSVGKDGRKARLDDSVESLVNYKEAESIAWKSGAVAYIENSAKTHENVIETFETATRFVVKYGMGKNGCVVN